MIIPKTQTYSIFAVARVLRRAHRGRHAIGRRNKVDEVAQLGDGLDLVLQRQVSHSCGDGMGWDVTSQHDDQRDNKK